MDSITGEVITTQEISGDVNTTQEVNGEAVLPTSCGATTWQELTLKPFETLDTGDFEVDENGVLHVIGGGTSSNAVWYPSVSDNGDISWVKSDSETAPTPKNIKGVKGDKGDTGEQGIQGLQGIQGEKGDTGEQGIQGIQGVKGDKGDTGEQGIQGLQGIQGEKGEKGDTGLQGVKGDKGDTGEQGIQGIQGEKGDNAYIHIKYSAIQPTQDSDISDTPNNYIGFYSGTSSIAPTSYTNYTWYKFKGEVGATGTAGSHIYWGENITGISTTPTAYTTGITYANIDDMYVSTASGSINNVYKCTTAGNDTTALWVYVSCTTGSGAIIDDTTTSTSFVWSSNKVNSELSNKADKTTISSDLTLTVAGWDSTAKTQTLSGLTIDTSRLNTPIPLTTSLKEYASCGIYLSSETSTSLTFTCDTTPTNDITFKLKSEVIT